MLLEVTVSGSVGKQISAADEVEQFTLHGLTLSPSSAANARVEIRDGKGGTSGELVFRAEGLSAQGARDFKVHHKFRKGMHVTIIGTSGAAYLVLS